MTIKVPTFLSVLKRGSKVVLPEGYCIEGLPKVNYLKVTHENNSFCAIFLLNNNGIIDALKAIEKNKIANQI
jgi:hypothetical protein